MAGDWIKMRGNLWDDPRVARLCDLTDQPEAAIVGGLYWLWATADQHTEDGIMPGLTLRAIDRKTGIQGFGQSLCDIGWLADHPEGVRIVKFEEHNGQSAKRRCTDAQRKASVRNVSADDADKKRTSAELEKRREEIKTSVAKATDGEPSKVDKKSPEERSKADLWKAAVSVLAAGGCGNEPVARSFMGKLVKDYGIEPVREAVAAAATAQPVDAREYLLATCQRLKGERKDPLTVAASESTEAYKARMAREAAQARANAVKPPAAVVELLKRTGVAA